MPIRINLKEIFPADSQEITVDKINFNFNKLLELGIGEQGLQGITGPIGSAGQVGLAGPQGERGSTWLVDSGTDPNSLTFTEDLIDGDLYLSSNDFSIWQYDGSQWNFVINLASIINNYLASSSSPFMRGLGIGSPSDDRFIIFNNRDDLSLDSLLGINGSNSTNDILFLNNFDENALAVLPAGFDFGPSANPIGDEIDTNDLYSSLLTISVDHRATTTGRYHLDLGDLYDDGGDPKMTSIYENLKVRFVREGVSVHTGQDHYNRALFSLDIPELSSATERLANGIFQFDTSKVLLSPSVERLRSTTYIGSSYAFDEIINIAPNTAIADGILFWSTAPSNTGGNIGLAVGYEINGGNYPADSGYVQDSSSNSYLMLDTPVNLEAIFLNNKVYQDQGNFIQLGSGGVRIKSPATSAKGSPVGFKGFMGITSIGGEVYTISGDKSIRTGTSTDLQRFGYFNKFTIDDANSPESKYSASPNNWIKFNGRTGGLTLGPGCVSGYDGARQPVGPGASDADSCGNYLYVVNNQTSATGEATNYLRTYFQILKTRTRDDIGLERISRLGKVSKAGADIPELIGAYRVKLHGDYAVVGTNFNAPASAPTIELDPNGYAGRLTLINVADPENPVVKADSFIPLTLASGIFSRAASILDFDILGDYIVSLVFEQVPTAFGVFSIRTRIQVSRLLKTDSDVPEIEHIGSGATSIANLSGLGISDATNSVHRFGAICATHDRIYAASGNRIRIFDFHKNTRTGTPPNCEVKYDLEGSQIPDFTSNQQIFDLKVLGNSLYVLICETDTNQSFINKYDIASTSPTLIYSNQITQGGQDYSATRMLIVGNQIYAAAHSTGSGEDNIPSLIPVDFDGIYTGGAHIESLRSDSVLVTKNANIGNSLNVGGAANIGSGLAVAGGLAVGGNIHATLTHVKANISRYSFTSISSQQLELDSIEYDALGEAATGTTPLFTASHTGYYLIKIYIVNGIACTADGAQLAINLTDSVQRSSFASQDAGNAVIRLIDTLYLEEGDTVSLLMSTFGGGGEYDISSSYSYFTIDRLV